MTRWVHGCGLLWAFGCAEKSAGSTADGDSTTPWVWNLPDHVPEPDIPADNPLTVEKVALGRVLFHDFQLSIDGGRSCGICHEQKKAFTDGFVKAVGTTGERHTRNTPSVLNVAWRTPLTWLNPDLVSLEEQLLGPLMGTEPVEMGMADQEALLLARVSEFEPYPQLFAAAFPDAETPLSMDHLGQAIASYERTLTSFDSPYDRYTSGDEYAMSAAALRGMDLFFGDRMACGECHNGLLFDRPLTADGTPGDAAGFYNTGQYNVDGAGGYPEDDPGLVSWTGETQDMGAFRTPSLRNVADAPPWNHDGTTASLEGVIDHYARGGRLVMSGPNPGDGADNPFKDPRITGFDLSGDERDDLMAFLASLSDSTVLISDPPQDPFCREVETDPEDCIPPMEF
jgi:cytochrome c peroxidase